MNIVRLATERRVTIAMITIALVMFGLIGLSRLKVNLLPDLSYPTLTVRTEYVGAAPAGQPHHLGLEVGGTEGLGIRAGPIRVRHRC